MTEVFVVVWGFADLGTVAGQLPGTYPTLEEAAVTAADRNSREENPACGWWVMSYEQPQRTNA